MYVTNLQVSFLKTRRKIYNFIYKLTLAVFFVVKQQKKGCLLFLGFVF